MEKSQNTSGKVVFIVASWTKMIYFQKTPSLYNTDQSVVWEIQYAWPEWQNRTEDTWHSFQQSALCLFSEIISLLYTDVSSAGRTAIIQYQAVVFSINSLVLTLWQISLAVIVPRSLARWSTGSSKTVGCFQCNDKYSTVKTHFWHQRELYILAKIAQTCLLILKMLHL